MDEEFATEVERPNDHEILFRVAPEFAAEWPEWSGAVRFRFRKLDDGTYVMELKREEL